MPNENPVSSSRSRDRRRVEYTADGPALIEGPVELHMPDGRVVRSDRFVVALCLCRRSANYPLCDTSHRRIRRQAP
ncbi:iron-binding CDGSH zinc finger protein [Nocardia neocaledoniensis]|uniref:Iron-binding CDGSH zinc finger protein n=1 Tax=Nocardia neocaledoniensis TaxID=236511 RepID=A0A317N9T2_9NOCA|nr:iron-binding CDGSH zinc finger protein [Nocardia neocaledoniensis]